MTINEAAVEILSKAAKPLSSTELATIAFNGKLINSNSKTPIKSLAYTIDKNIREGIYNNPRLIFMHTSLGRLIGLPEWKDKDFNIDIQKRKSNFQKITISLPTNLIENINLAYQAKIADTFDETLIYILHKGVSNISHIIKENISKQLRGLEEIGQSTTSHNFQDSIQANIKSSRTDDHRKLGRKGYEQIEDYLIPAILLMRQGNSHSDAFHIIAKKLDVTYQTVNAQCTRRLGISTEDFSEFVKNGQILRLIKIKHPEKSEMINRKLGDLH